MPQQTQTNSDPTPEIGTDPLRRWYAARRRVVEGRYPTLDQSSVELVTSRWASDSLAAMVQAVREGRAGEWTGARAEARAYDGLAAAYQAEVAQPLCGE